jgi:hypothetical protein
MKSSALNVVDHFKAIHRELVDIEEATRVPLLWFGEELQQML